MEKTTEQQKTNLIKIVLFGPESTGKTTLANQLAKHYNTVWVPEYSRTYAQQKWDNGKKILTAKDVLPIVEGQLKNEETFTHKANKVLICDTDVLETKVYCDVYYEAYPKAILDKIIALQQYHFYFLTYIDVPWEKDNLRDKPNEREKMFNLFQQALIEYSKPHLILKGNKETRLKTAIETIDKLILRTFKKEKQNKH